MKFKICKKIKIKILPIVLYGGLVTAKLQEEKDKMFKIFKRPKVHWSQKLGINLENKVCQKLKLSKVLEEEND